MTSRIERDLELATVTLSGACHSGVLTAVRGEVRFVIVDLVAPWDVHYMRKI